MWKAFFEKKQRVCLPNSGIEVEELHLTDHLTASALTSRLHWM
jgi:hypothetical protein